MSGIGLVLSSAKDALLTQQYAISVVSHNISNVSTDGYTRQSPVFNAQEATPYGGHLFGRGVELGDILRNTNNFLEQRLKDSNTDFSRLNEKQIYLDVMESIFNENSSKSLSSQLADFWNSWDDLANNPAGLAERNVISDYGTLLSDTFNDIALDLVNLENEMEHSIETGVTNVNQLLEGIAEINRNIIVNEIHGSANDLRDKRNIMVNELANYIDINTYENESGTLTVTTGKGYTLVSKTDSYLLSYDGNDVNWESSGDLSMVISDSITGGKLGGWLDVRDEVIPKYKADLDELAKSIIWEVNKVHTQGVGLEGYSSTAGTYQSADTTQAMGSTDSGLDFADKIDDGSFKIWLYDASGNVVGETSVVIDADTTTMEDLAATISNMSIGGEDALNSTIVDGYLNMEIDSATNAGYTFAFSDDTSNVLAALGVSTFFDSANAYEISVSENILGNKNSIAAATINNNISPVSSATGNTSTGVITTSGPYTGTGNAFFEIEVITGGDETTAEIQWRNNGGAWTGPIAVSGSPITLSDGVQLTFNTGTYTVGDTFSIDAVESSDTYGDFAFGDNSNALNLNSLQYEEVNIRQWTYERGSTPNYEEINNSTIDDYLHLLVGSVGIQSQSVQREMESTEVIKNQVNESRDNISAVSLDEEMASLIKYQQAYTAAAKLITTAEEMLDTLLNTI